MTATADARYVEVSKRALNATNFGAITIIVAILIACLDDSRRFAIAVALHVVVFPLNLVFNKLVLRFGGRMEIYRSLMNAVVCALGYELIDWPLPVWFWMPFSALTFQSGNATVLTLTIMCGTQSLAAVVHGVPWVYPISFTALTFVSYRVAKARMDIIESMLFAAEARRDEVARAHDALKNEVAARERVELELRHAQKLEAVGRLAAGVAHEINTPIQFVGNSLGFVEDGVRDLLLVAEQVDPRTVEHVDLGFLKAQLPIAISLANDGVKRVATIVGSMKQFMHPGQHVIGPLDLDAAITNTLTLSRHEYKLVADVETRLGGVPPIECNPGEIGQVLLNIIINAAHAIADRVQDSTDRGTITVTSKLDGDRVVIEIADTGAGIPEAVRDRIFDPFFTTKEVGRGTGQGLAISKAIVERHRGTLDYETEVGRGTTFTLSLPRAPARAAAA